MREILLRIFAHMIIFLPMTIALIVGGIRYIKSGKEIRQELETERKKYEQQGGVGSLYHKRTDRRSFKRTFGLPILIAFGTTLLCLILLLILV